MKLSDSQILTINGGSSSIKFALYQAVAPLKRGPCGQVDRIGLSGTNLTFNDPAGDKHERCSPAACDHTSAANFLIDWIEEHDGFDSLGAVGHRVVNGMDHSVPELVTRELLDELQRISPYDPEHVLSELARLGDPAATTGQVIFAHLGNGTSIAVRDSKSIDTSMSFTPTAGLVMSTRSGDLDPGIAPYLARTEQTTTSQFYEMVTKKSGLLGVSEISSDMRDLLTQEAHNVRAAEAVALFCYQAKKFIGAFAAALGGLDTLVFAGGIGENAPYVRTRICDELAFLGIEVDELRNAETAGVISKFGSRATIRVIHTDEEQMIAGSVYRLLDSGTASEKGWNHENNRAPATHEYARTN